MGEAFGKLLQLCFSAYFILVGTELSLQISSNNYDKDTRLSFVLVLCETAYRRYLYKMKIKIKPTDRPYKYMSMRREPENLFGVALY